MQILLYLKTIPIKYPAIEVGNEFLVGFGLDYNGIGRNLQDIYIIEENNNIHMITDIILQ